MTSGSLTELVAGLLGVVGLAAFGALVVIPAVSSYRRAHERVAAALLSVYLLAALAAVGAIVGVLITIEWPRFF
jgi:hypothetical protein